MQTTRRVSWLAALALTAWSTGPARAHHTTFSASVDRFEIDGNAFGPADGVPDQVDEFDDGTIAPNWQVLLGTAIESGGVLTLRDPGVDINLVPGAALDISNVENTIDVSNGAGNFTATSYWTSPPLALNTQIHFQLYALGAVVEAAGMTFANLATGSGSVPAGYSISQEVTFILGGGGVPQTNTVAINPADITGQIVLRMAFDDATDTMLCSFSLDGGATFQSPFPPLHVFQVVQDSEILLGANSIAPTGPPPPPPPTSQTPVGTKLLLVKNSSTPAARRVVYQVKDAPNGAFLGGAPPLYGATFNLKVGDTSQCFQLPHNYWKYSSGGYRYLDHYGLFGPVKLAKVRRTSNGTFTAKIAILGKLGQVDIVPPNAPVYGDMNLRLNGIPSVEYCGSTAGGVISANDLKTFKVKGAPAPAACTLAACSPSGAFLDEAAEAF